MVKLTFAIIMLIGFVGCWLAHDRYHGNCIPDDFFDYPSGTRTYSTTWDVSLAKTSPRLTDSLGLVLIPKSTEWCFWCADPLIQFELPQRSRVSFWFCYVKDSTWSEPIIDTLNAGFYYVINGRLKYGDYLLKAQIGDSIRMKAFSYDTLEVK